MAIDPTITLEVILGAGGFLWYILNRRARDRRIKARLASTLLDELVTILSRIRTAKEHPDSDQPLFPLPSSTYNGLTSSTNISYFDRRIPGVLHGIYTTIEELHFIQRPTTHANLIKNIEQTAIGNLDEMLGTVEKAVTLVEQFRDRHRYRGRWLAILKAIHWEYDD